MSGRGPRLISVSRDTHLRDIPEGELIKLNESGSPVEFYVAKHDYEPELNGSGRTLLVRKNRYDTRAFRNGGNAFIYSAIETWLNNTWLKLLDADIQTAISTTKFYFTPGNGNNTVTTLERAAFLLSVTELGKSASYANTEGSALPIASSLQIIYYNGIAVSQWTRSPSTNGVDSVCYLDKNGAVTPIYSTSVLGARPVFTLPSDFILTDDML